LRIVFIGKKDIYIYDFVVLVMKTGKEGAGSWKNWVIGVLVIVVFFQLMLLFDKKDLQLSPPSERITPIRPWVTWDYWTSLSVSQQADLLARQQANMDVVRARQDEVLLQMKEDYEKKVVEYDNLVKKYHKDCDPLIDLRKTLQENYGDSASEAILGARDAIDKFEERADWQACLNLEENFNSIKSWLDNDYPNNVIDFNNAANEVAACAIGSVSPNGFYTPTDDCGFGPFKDLFTDVTCNWDEC